MPLFDIGTPDTPQDEEIKPSSRLRTHTVRGKSLFDRRRFMSENALLQSAPWHFAPDTADFYKSFFDDIQPFNYKDFQSFQPYEP